MPRWRSCRPDRTRRAAPELGREVIAAFVAGYEIACRIGMALRPGHYDRGFHATGTVGCFGAAAACAHLLGLDAEATARALGIAGTQAAGLKSQFGTMCKPFHAGKASHNGLLAARLAARGFSSRDDLVECEQGFALTHSPDFAPAAALATPPNGFHIFGNLFKYHAACYLTHGAIECARALREQHGVEPEQVARLTLSLDRSCDRVCNIPAPTDGLEAKFSLRQTVAMALSGVDTASLGAYSPATATDPALVRLREKLDLDFHDGWPQAAAELEVALNDGRVLRASHDAGIPSADIAAQGERLVANSMRWPSRSSAPRPRNCARPSSASAPRRCQDRGPRGTVNTLNRRPGEAGSCPLGRLKSGSGFRRDAGFKIAIGERSGRRQDPRAPRAVATDRVPKRRMSRPDVHRRCARRQDCRRRRAVAAQVLDMAAASSGAAKRPCGAPASACAGRPRWSAPIGSIPRNSIAYTRARSCIRWPPSCRRCSAGPSAQGT
jgi:hypothetical protein